ncbi:tail fiber protein [Mycetohabitans sp. B8]|uniref:phage tail protein n=1 Tax=Mycetohabitans sp. B8 TaxID=2841845 RepID=UPI001F1AC169|nr:phage tail protein [Mycetohabitans sp. B8]MCG1042499.1 tail fiber protein [Mycetohabitans sp. B8]
MPIPQTIDELDTNPNNNSPQGNEAVGPFANGYIQTLSAFIKQLANGKLKPTEAVDMNAQKITNVTRGSTETDVVTFGQMCEAAPPGQIGYFFRTSAPRGWLVADGSRVSRTAYSALWEAMGCPDTGDGSATFTLPDLRGYFLRGLDLGAGRDSDRTLGSVQDSQNKAHAHAASASEDGNHVHSAWTDEQGWHRHGIHDPGHNHGTEVPHGGGHAHFQSVVGPYGISGYYNTHHAHTGISIHDAGNHAHTVSMGDAGNHSHTITVNDDGGEESRPVNVALLICIKI